MKRRSKRKIAVSATTALTLAIFIIAFANKVFGDKIRSTFAPSFPDFDKTQDFVKIMDVGQADAALIYSNGCSAVIDAGLTSSADDISADLKSADIKDIDALLITHLHMDYAGALAKIAMSFPIDNLIIPNRDSSAEAMPTVNEAEKRVVAEKGKVFTATEGINFNIGEFEVTLLAYFPDATKENDRSVITMAKIGDKKFLFTGDAEKATEADVLAEKLNIDCDVLKVGHHGSNSSSTSAFLKAASPEYAAISVGKDNMYSHPSNKTLTALKNCGAKIYRTDKNGDISFYVENGNIRVETEKE